MTLLPGDVIRRAPRAVARTGDRVEIEIEGIGSLVNPVVRAFRQCVICGDRMPF